MKDYKKLCEDLHKCDGYEHCFSCSHSLSGNEGKGAFSGCFIEMLHEAASAIEQLQLENSYKRQEC